MTTEEHELLKDIISEQIELCKDENDDPEFRQEIRNGLIEIREMIHRALISNGETP